jgi:cardiolipin synthase
MELIAAADSAFVGWLVEHWQAVAFYVAWFGLGLPAAIHAVMFKRDSRSAAIWAYICLTLPVFGSWLYWAWGVNRVERRAIKFVGRRRQPWERTPDPDPQTIRSLVGHLHDLRTVADAVARLPLLTGNRLEPLHNGEEAYPRMLEAIAAAKQTITMESYIFDRDDVGYRFIDALGAAAERGVKVHVLFDGIGALDTFSRRTTALKRRGVQAAAFFPLGFPFGRVRMNLRNHRKILVVDGRLGFTGGMNISERHLRHGSSPDRCEDLHFVITGPVVTAMQHAFIEDWATATDETLTGENYFPELTPTGPVLCRAISSGPDEDLGIVLWIVQAALAAARQHVWIVTPYFVPPSTLIAAMAMAARRGVRVTLVLPDELDYPFMRWVADASLWQVLEHGVEVYRRKPPFVHTKLMIVDDQWVLLGSANMDPRSLRLNFEFNVEAYDMDLARELSTWLAGLLPECHRVTMEELDARPRWVRLRDGVTRLLSPYL